MNKLTLVSVSSLALIGCSGKEIKKTEKPNLVFIMADQWRGDAMGFWGKEPVKTPNMDALSKQGIVFNEAMSTYPVSSPARGMLMTGMYSFNNNLTTNCMSHSAPYGVELDKEAICWSDILKAKDYKTGYIGKWHLDSPHEPYIDTYNNKGGMAWNEWCPPDRRHGFDYWMAYGTYDLHMKPMYWATDAPREDFHYADKWGPEYEVDRAIEFIDEQKDNPFALVISMNPPHMPYDQVPDKYKEIYKNLNVDEVASLKPSIPAKGTKWGDYFRKNIANYYACITGVDEQIGRVVNKLKEEGLFENTILVITSDHGDCIGTHDQISKSNPYRESINIPMIITYPEKIRPRIDKTAQLGFQDMYPTLLSLMGYEKDIPKNVEVVDFADYILEKEANPAPWQPYVKLNYKDLTSGERGIRSNEYTYVEHYEKGKLIKTFLVDNINDPYQMNNIAEQEKELCEKFSRIAAEMFKKMNDPLFK